MATSAGTTADDPTTPRLPRRPLTNQPRLTHLQSVRLAGQPGPTEGSRRAVRRKPNPEVGDEAMTAEPLDCRETFVDRADLGAVVGRGLSRLAARTSRASLACPPGTSSRAPCPDWPRRPLPNDHDRANVGDDSSDLPDGWACAEPAQPREHHHEADGIRNHEPPTVERSQYAERSHGHSRP